jgi:hypothetical protein
VIPRTHTRELTDRSYWRRLMATAHPDRNGGDGELFVFCTALRVHVEECMGSGSAQRMNFGLSHIAPYPWVGR